MLELAEGPVGLGGPAPWVSLIALRLRRVSGFRPSVPAAAYSYPLSNSSLILGQCSFRYGRRDFISIPSIPAAPLLLSTRCRARSMLLRSTTFSIRSVPPPQGDSPYSCWRRTRHSHGPPQIHRFLPWVAPSRDFRLSLPFSRTHIEPPVLMFGPSPSLTPKRGTMTSADSCQFSRTFQCGLPGYLAYLAGLPG